MKKSIEYFKNPAFSIEDKSGFEIIENSDLEYVKGGDKEYTATPYENSSKSFWRQASVLLDQIRQ